MTYGGKVMFTTYVADNDVAGAACGIGHTRVYAMDLDDCTGGYVEGRDWGPEEHAVSQGMYVEFEGVPSTTSLANRGWTKPLRGGAERGQFEHGGELSMG